MSRSVCLPIANDGKPLFADTTPNGVLILPALAPEEDFKLGHSPLFDLIFQLNASSSVTRNATFHTNIPQKPEELFDRSNYANIPISTSFHQDVTIPFKIYRPGTYSYYIEYEKDSEKTKTDKYYFVVPPNLYIADKYLAFNDINIELVVSKWIGPLDVWNDFFAEVSKRGYNMIHFTPLQERGELDSPYSIYDQLQFDPKLFTLNKEASKFLKDILAKNNLASLTDVVWNHTANNSAWLRDHPDAGYNVETAPHLQSAIELDAKLLEYSLKLEELGLPTEVTEENIDKILDGLQPHVFDALNLWQFYVYNRETTIENVEKAYEELNFSPNFNIPSSVDIFNSDAVAKYAQEVAGSKIVLLDRYSNTLDPANLVSVILAISELGKTTSLDQLKKKAGEIVDILNVNLYKTYNDDVSSIKRQIGDRLRFLRLSDNGPKLGKITAKLPLSENYFTRFKDNKEGKDWALANNGWIWGGNPLEDFAGPNLKAYLRREVIIWGDCVKLRYGSGPEDSPYVWEHMIKYTTMCAELFDGFRIDNCHLTPLIVGQRLLDEARKVNPNLYVVAELFLGSEEMDKIFVERLGINSLIREAMQAWNVEELSRLVHRHGGRPIGSLSWMPLDGFAYPADKEPSSTNSMGVVTELGLPKIISLQSPHALFMDCTHDNETPAQKRTVEDTLPNAALVAFCLAAIGSTFGYDDCYPHLLDVVNETRQYTYGNNGIGEIKSKLHSIRKQLALESIDTDQDNETYIHHEGQYITVQRYNSRTANGWFLVARSKFSADEGYQQLTDPFLGGTKVKAEFAYSLKKTGDYESSKTKLTGIPVEVVELDAATVEWNGKDSIIHVDASKFPPGSIAVFSTKIPDVDENLDNYVKLGALDASTDLNLYDINALLYKCAAEELDNSGGSGSTYDIPKYGHLVYAGLQGWISVLRNVVWNNELAHAICDHLRDGEWAYDYIINRLDKYSSSKGVARFQTWLRERFDAIRKVPYFLRPRYFALVVGTAYEALRFRALRQLGSNIQQATSFVQSLALTSVQMLGTMNNTSLVALEQVPNLAAGLPHFSNDYMRSWGRDVFILFRGLLIVTERFEDAKRHILGFAQTLKHGLIPNLLDSGRNPRYNARDAAWFFAQAVQEYVNFAPDGEKILEEKVKRRFPLDDTWIPYDDERAYSYETLIRDILFEILQRHAKGISYREANAGPNLDSQMTDEGFNVSVHVDWSNGLIFGGSRWNCGTWMDKMGESTRAGNKGYPGTPRDGAAVELQGLLKSTLRFVNDLNKKGLFPYTKVEKNDGTSISLKDWEQLIQDNFERTFYIPEDPSQDSEFDVDPNLINRRGIYKDLYRSGSEYEDYQLRPNFAIAMTAAPELFTVERALSAIKLSDKVIKGPLGMRTLDPLDWNYHPYYRNSEDNEDFATSKGRNYHQGPEWVWNIGYFFRAFLYFNHLQNKENSKKVSEFTLGALNDRLQPHMKWIQDLPWAGLTELTNKDAELCDDSSPTQAWSGSCLLDLYQDLWTLEVYKS